MPKFQASISVYRAAKLLPLQPAPCYPEIFKIYLCLAVLRQLPPLNPRLAITKLQRAQKSHLLRNPDTRNARDTPEPKEPPSSNGGGTFVTYPTFRTV